jgi:hypothetical protein
MHRSMLLYKPPTVPQDDGPTMITAYFSSADAALVVELDTRFEPNIQGVRVWLNDEEHILAIPSKEEAR